MAHPTDGILLVDKDGGQTSYSVVNEVKSAVRKLEIRKVGHAGTLDPFATGLLIILLGQGAKLSRFIMSESKVYLATMKLGVETDTLDPTGRAVRTRVVPDLSPEYIQEKAREFVGKIEQIPPIYSAVKYMGTRAYKLARRGLHPGLKKRTVTVHSLRILSVDLPDVTMAVRCSGGTYIRSLAADLGRELGPGGHLKSLRRLACGAFKVKNAVRSGEISNMSASSSLQERVIPLRAALPNMGEIEVEEQLVKKVRQGHHPAWEELAKGVCEDGYEDGHVKLVNGDDLVAIVKLRESKGVARGQGKIRIVRVFS
jgi:tRNA pseudouridine55 synthase